MVKHFFETYKNIHRLNMLSKPYTKEKQKQVIFDHQKRLKRECFALKLTILNNDEESFKYLWGGEMRTFWNLGHLLMCLKQIIKVGWERGLTLIFSATTSKVIFMSVNTSVGDFTAVIDLLQSELY
jgi:hypothetical protein